jgi:hypothetical protein
MFAFAVHRHTEPALGLAVGSGDLGTIRSTVYFQMWQQNFGSARAPTSPTRSFLVRESPVGPKERRGHNLAMRRCSPCVGRAFLPYALLCEEEVHRLSRAVLIEAAHS